MKIKFTEDEIKNLMISHCASYRTPLQAEPFGTSVCAKITATLQEVPDGTFIVGEVTIE